ncbi:MAG: DUF748 domain-containing protein, partial [Psychromonas sp.]|nr:DUF748 domain-containing protein [Psychromonas sp.]
MQKLISRKFYRSVLFWILSLITAYTLAGFFLVPNIIHKTLVEQVKQQLGWQAEIGKIEFNPYAFTLAIHNLKISDQQAQEQLSFSRYYMNFELRSIIERAFTFADIELLNPTIRVEIDKNGITNFQHALQLQQQKIAPQPPTENKENSDATLPKMLFDNIDIIAGKIKIIDHSPAQTIEHQLDPITFNLKELFTYNKKAGDYDLHIALGNDQTINWRGTIGVAPFRSTGSLKINGIKAHEFWSYLSEQVPYTLKNARVGFSGNYQVSMEGESAQFKIAQGKVNIDDIQLANKQQTQAFADIKAVEIGPLEFNLAEKKLQVKRVKIDTVNLDIERNQQGVLNILAPFAEPKTESAPANTDDNEKSVSQAPFQWSVANIILTNSHVNFIDRQPTNQAQV